MSCPPNQQFHLFNCDNTYSLNVIEKLLQITKSKVGFEFSVEKHDFPLCQMAELCTDKIPKLKMDFAIFVVHANESRLSINEENAGIGYAKVYRALRQATGDKVVIVIGGDDNYKNQDEKDRSVISRWARRKISSQFTEEFLDGRKSFIFSWYKEHRPIHEEAMLHYFDPKKEGQKFDFQPKKQVLTSPVPGEDRAKPALTSVGVSKSNSCVRSDVSQHSKAGTYDSGTRKREELPSNKETPDSASGASAKMEDVVILGCNASDESVSAVYQVIQDLKPKLNLKSDPPIVSQPPGELKSYLMGNKVKFCLLVVDAEAVMSALKNSQLRMEYEEVLKTASDKVVEKVIVAICGPPLFLESDEATVAEAINSILQRSNKGFPVWLKGGHLQMSSEVLLEILQSVPKTSESTGDLRVRDEHPVSSWNYSHDERTKRCLTRTQSDDYSGKRDTSSIPSLKQSRFHDQQSAGVDVRSHSLDRRATAVPASNQPYDQQSRAGHVTRTSPSDGASVPASKQPYDQQTRGGQVRSHSSYEAVSAFPATHAGKQPYDQQSRCGHVMPPASQITRNVTWSSPSNQPHNQLSRDGTIKSLSADGGEAIATQSLNVKGVKRGWVYNLKGENVDLMIKAHIRYGKISLEDGDFWFRNWTVPDYIQECLMSKHSDTSDAELLIYYDKNGTLRISVTPKWNLLPSFFRKNNQEASLHELLAPNESLMLKSLIRNGNVSQKPEDVEYRYPGWQIPDDIIKSIEQNDWATSKADLFIISDELGNLRSVVRMATVRGVQTFLKKLTHNVNEVTMKNP